MKKLRGVERTGLVPVSATKAGLLCPINHMTLRITEISISYYEVENKHG
jgi:hypothetical protein